MGLAGPQVPPSRPPVPGGVGRGGSPTGVRSTEGPAGAPLGNLCRLPTAQHRGDPANPSAREFLLFSGSSQTPRRGLAGAHLFHELLISPIQHLLLFNPLRVLGIKVEK